MEKKEQLKQFDYNATSNLVLTSENRKRDAGPSSEVHSLVGRLTPSEMQRQFGERVARSRPQELEERLKKAKAAKRKRATQDTGDDDEGERRKRKTVKTDTVLNADVDEDVYRPQTRETRVVYEVLLNFIQQELPDKPDDVLRSAADEVLAILKDDNLKDKEKQQQVESLFRRRVAMTIDRFSELLNISKRITDYTATEETEEKIDEDLGVNLVLEQDEDEEDIDEIRDEDMDEAEDGIDADVDMAIETKVDDSMDVDDAAAKNHVEARAIDAFWLQREINVYYKDPHKAQQLSESVLEVLGDKDTDDRATENKLVLLLDGYDKFDFIKKLLVNRAKIFHCTRLARAKDDEARGKIEADMQADPDLRQILEDMTRTSSSNEKTVELGRKLKSEAMNISKREDEPGNEADPFMSKRPKNILDFDSMKFESGGHFMSQKECKLPKGSEVVNKKGYQEVHIPPLAPKQYAGDEKHVLITDMPEWTHSAFKKMKQLNRVQSKVYQTALFSAENMLLCAPTGAGKTNCAMLTILREIGLHRNEAGDIDLDAFKIVYVAPMKSLVQEMVMNFSQRLKDLGITVKELSGDQQLTKQQIQETQIIVTTPEKWDIVTRKSGDRTYTQLVRLLIIDEVHLLHDDRGPVLESIIARSIRQVETTAELIRIVGLSATLPNYTDVAMLLRVNADKGLFFFDNSFRPCPLQQQFIGITQKKAFKRMELMNQITYEKVMQSAGKHQVLVFVHSRKETANTAKVLRDMALENDELSKFMEDDSGRRELLKSMAEEEVKDEDLKEILPYGFACHHAGMSRSDRTLVEDLFADKHIQVLVSTATLAWGVNLPAHTVIIKGTQIYSPEKGEWVELSPQDILQMLGRAGRPQYDEYGEGIVITSHRELHYYLSLLNEQLPIESQLLSRLPDVLNAEIVMGSVTNIKDAVVWLGYSYLFIRMLRAPQLYGVPYSEIETDKLLEQRRIDIIHTAAVILDKHNLIKYDRKTGNLHITDLGRVASHYYITYQSMGVFNEYLKPTMSDIELFRVFSLASEFKYMTVRQEEKMELAQLLDKVPIPVKESMEEGSAKVNVLLQTYISKLKLDGFALMSDMVYITQSAGRIMRAIFEIVVKRGWAAVAEKALSLCHMITHRMWGAQSPLRQFRGIPPEVIKRIENKDEFTWDRLCDLDEHALGEHIRFPKLGKLVHKAIHQLPRLELQGQVQPITRTVLRVQLSVTPDFLFNEKVHGNVEPFWIFVEDVDGEHILHYEYFLLKRRYAEEEHVLNFTIPIHDPLPPHYYVRVMSDRWLGAVSVYPISFRHLLLPEKYPAPTELLDLQPLPTASLANEKFINFFSKQKIDVFNPIQTQCFNALYKSSNNVLLAAPTGSGKTICAEIAIMKMLNDNPAGRCVYVAPLKALAKERYIDWSVKFEPFGVSVKQLTGELNADTKLLATGQIIVCTPDQWDILSRRWTTRKNVQTVALFLVDELHLIGGEVGPTIEIIVSRMRYIASQTEKPIRVVGLSASVANARDLGSWVGATSSTLFNFHPNVRPVPLEIRIQGFDMNDYLQRQLAMSKPCFLHIKKHSAKSPVMVFAPSRKEARRIAIDIVTYAAADDTATRFLRVDKEDLAPHLKRIRNNMLRETLQAGVGFYHEGLSERERTIVETLYNAGAIQVVVVEQCLCWGLPMSAHMVILMGTQFFDGREHRYVDLPITDVLQMMGRAIQPGRETTGKCTIFCHTPKKDFYKKFLYEPFPVESHLDHYLADHFNAEIVTKRIENVQDAIDYLTWTFFYRRLTKNPNYYNLQGVTHRHLSDRLSELVENTLSDLEQSNCISIEDETELSPLNLGMIASYYYIKYTSVERFSQSLTAKTKLKGLLHALSWAAEFEGVPVRHREDHALRQVAMHLPLTVEEAGNYTDPHTKTNVLLQSHFSRIPLNAAVAADQRAILPDSLRLLQAMVDVISSQGWLKPVLGCMELSQMVTQGMWRTDSPLLQLPHLTKDIVAGLEKHGVESIYDFLDMEDADRQRLVPLSDKHMADVAAACNAYPNIELAFEVKDEDEVSAGAPVTVVVQLERDEDELENGVPVVSAPRYPHVKNEGWWVVLGDVQKNTLLSIKRVVTKKPVTAIKLDFAAPAQGAHNLKLYLMCDSYLGCDQEHDLTLNVAEGVAGDSDSESSDSDDGKNDAAKMEE